MRLVGTAIMASVVAWFTMREREEIAAGAPPVRPAESYLLFRILVLAVVLAFTAGWLLLLRVGDYGMFAGTSPVIAVGWFLALGLFWRYDRRGATDWRLEYCPVCEHTHMMGEACVPGD
jgi:hypothetical protein